MIVAVIVFFKHCRMWEVAKKRDKPATPHRCTKNISNAKSKERDGAVEHCKAIYMRDESNVRAYIKQIVTDDYSTTRANLRHSIKAVLDDRVGDGGWTKSEHWPCVDADPDKKFLPDNGLMPLWVPQVLLYLCDISHRVKCIGSTCYDIKKGKDPRPIPQPPVIAVLDDEEEDTEDGSPSAKATTQKTKKKAATKPKRPPKKPWNELT